MQPRRRNRLWIVFFLVLTLLGGIAIVVPIVYNLGLLLRPEQLAEARRHWARAGNKDYDLWVEERKTNAAGDVVQRRFLVQVRRSKASSPDGSPMTVDELFDHIAADLKTDAARTDRRNYATATFDPVDGHPVRYVHRIAATSEREEWLIRLTPPASDTDNATSNPQSWLTSPVRISRVPERYSVYHPA